MARKRLPTTFVLTRKGPGGRGQGSGPGFGKKRGQRFEINPGGKTGGKGTGVNANTGGGG